MVFAFYIYGLITKTTIPNNKCIVSHKHSRYTEQDTVVFIMFPRIIHKCGWFIAIYSYFAQMFNNIQRIMQNM